MPAKEFTNLVKISNFCEFLKLPVVSDRLGTNGLNNPFSRMLMADCRRTSGKLSLSTIKKLRIGRGLYLSIFNCPSYGTYEQDMTRVNLMSLSPRFRIHIHFMRIRIRFQGFNYFQVQIRIRIQGTKNLRIRIQDFIFTNNYCFLRHITKIHFLDTVKNADPDPDQDTRTQKNADPDPGTPKMRIQYGSGFKPQVEPTSMFALSTLKMRPDDLMRN